MSVPKCTSWRGHKFEARYSLTAAPALTQQETLFGWSFDYAAMLEQKRKKTYECDVCVRCGHVVQPPVVNVRA